MSVVTAAQVVAVVQTIKQTVQEILHQFHQLKVQTVDMVQVQVLHNLKQVAEAEVQVKPAVHINQQAVQHLVVTEVLLLQYLVQRLNLFTLQTVQTQALQQMVYLQVAVAEEDTVIRVLLQIWVYQMASQEEQAAVEIVHTVQQQVTQV